MSLSNMKCRKLRFWRGSKRSVTITEYDATYKVVYLGNVLTAWAKGDGCADKPLATLWRNYCTSNKADVAMKVTVGNSGLKATTKEHGLTEYWANRITHCVAHPHYPRLFAWVYRHEGKRLKQELRCHAVLCSKEEHATTMSDRLQAKLQEALQEFRREKLSRQKARLSLANSCYDNPSLPRRKILLSTGTANYRPPLERSKSAPKLFAIEENEENDYYSNEQQSAATTEQRQQRPLLLPNSKTTTTTTGNNHQHLSLAARHTSLGLLHHPAVSSTSTSSSSKTSLLLLDDFVDEALEEDYVVTRRGVDDHHHHRSLNAITTIKEEDDLLDGEVLDEDDEDQVVQDSPGGPHNNNNNNNVMTSLDSEEEEEENDSDNISDNISDESGYSEETMNNHQTSQQQFVCKM